MSLIASSAAHCFSGPDFCLIFAPYGYDDPEILPTRKPPAVSKALTADTLASSAASGRCRRHRLTLRVNSNLDVFWSVGSRDTAPRQASQP
jgi:hypothetical protein